MAQNNIDLADILDESLDLGDLAELGAVPHIGTHRMTLNWSGKAIKDKPYIEMELVLLETLELSGEDADKEHQKPGLKSNMLFEKNGGMSEGKLRAILDSLAPSVGTTKALEILKASNASEVIVQTSKRTSTKDGNTVTYPDIKGIQMV